MTRSGAWAPQRVQQHGSIESHGCMHGFHDSHSISGQGEPLFDGLGCFSLDVVAVELYAALIREEFALRSQEQKVTR